MKSIYKKSTLLAAILACVVSNQALALDINSENSKVSLVSTKVLGDGATSISEVFAFTSVSGKVADNGAATVTIDLASVETGIDIRNQRMGEFFFQVSEYPEAKITAQIPDSALEQGSQLMELEVAVDMHGSQVDYLVPVVITSDEQSVVVVATEPVLVDAANFELKGGLNKLGELAGLLHIPTTVPVSFNLEFTR